MRATIVVAGIVLIAVWLVLLTLFGTTTCDSRASQIQSFFCSLGALMSTFGVLILILGCIVVGMGLKLESKKPQP